MLSALARCITSSINYIMPKKTLYAFYSPFFMKGNVSELYNYYLENEPEKTFIIKSEKLSDPLYRKEIFQKLMMSKVLFLSHGIGGLPITWMLATKVQLWHGIPMKKVMLDCDVGCNRSNKIKHYLFKERIEFSYDYLVTGNGVAANSLAKSFGYKNHRILRFGTPIYKEIKCIGNDLMFAPTWRSSKEQTNKFIDTLTNLEISSAIKSRKGVTYLCPHPYDKEEYIKRSSELLTCGYEIRDFDYNLIQQCSMVITDYSSFIFDFNSETIAKVIFAPDIESYTKERSLYNYYHENVDARTSEVIAKIISEDVHVSKKNYLDLFSSQKNSCELIFNNFKT